MTSKNQILPQDNKACKKIASQKTLNQIQIYANVFSIGAHSSAVELLSYKQAVIGSNPVAPIAEKQSFCGSSSIG